MLGIIGYQSDCVSVKRMKFSNLLKLLVKVMGLLLFISGAVRGVSALRLFFQGLREAQHDTIDILLLSFVEGGIAFALIAIGLLFLFFKKKTVKD